MSNQQSESPKEPNNLPDLLDEQLGKSLRLKIRSIQIEIGCGNEDCAIHLYCDNDVDHARGMYVLANDDKIMEIPVLLSVRRGKPEALERVQAGEPIGFLKFFPVIDSDYYFERNDSSISGEVYVTESVYSDLFEIAKSEVCGESVYLAVRGLDFDERLEPISCKVWVTESVPILHVIGLSMRTHAIDTIREDETDEALEADDSESSEKVAACKYCAESMKTQAEVCPQCGRRQNTDFLIYSYLVSYIPILVLLLPVYFFIRWINATDYVPSSLGPAVTVFFQKFSALVFFSALIPAGLMLSDANVKRLNGKLSVLEEKEHKGCIWQGLFAAIAGSFILSVALTLWEARDFLGTFR